MTELPSRWVPCLSAVALLALACAGPPGDPRHVAEEPVLREVVDRVGEEALAAGIVGLSIGVAVGGEIAYARGFGHADLARRHPASADTIYDAASVGKQFTAAAALLLAERGRLQLDQRIRELVPVAPRGFPDATLHELLTHTSGFVDGELDEQDPPASWSGFQSGTVLLDDPALQSGVARFAPGETWCYANANYLLAGLAVESAAGRAYHEFVAEELLAPVHPSLHACAELDGPHASGSFLFEEGVTRPVDFVHVSNYGGQGSIRASVLGLLAWQRALDEHRLLSPASVAAMRSPTRVRGDHDTALVPYGAAIRLGHLGAHAKLGHTGTFDGGSAVLARYPDAGLTIAILSNTNGSGVPHALRLEARIARALLDEAELERPSTSLPVAPEDARRLAGLYAGSQRIDASVKAGELVARIDGTVVERLAHVGDLVFRRVDSPTDVEWFLPDGDRAGWWLLEREGFLWDVLRRD